MCLYDKVQRTTSRLRRLQDFVRSYDFTTLTTLRLLIDLDSQFCTINPVSRSTSSREVVKVVRSYKVVKSSSRDVVL
jgi:hypothetical protein